MNLRMTKRNFLEGLSDMFYLGCVGFKKIPARWSIEK
jgi:hypothetical protein